ncbi:PREDICTED: carbonic anhydrase 6 [Condylura cristata]|uniref:carbonic anhydrase 6 n=1 Tax=Condylura cristata TaxID=143302 RepID=UPI0003343B35|nr:PREDICTED: carbonic anhydrase 6 [Condylura cristata]XP_012577496.1 PREDICTED: carbonic anhydrase 6 [Condylura cristata]
MKTLVPLLSLFLLGVQAQHADWTYSEGELDEEHWASKYPACGGHRQSPVNLQKKKARYNPHLRPLILHGYGDQEGAFPMTNNGHTVQITLPQSMHFIAPDGTRYFAQQMHLHWGGASKELSGSEHTINGMRYVAEIHIVHYNAKYGSFAVAQSAQDGLAVVAALVEIQDYTENTYYSDFIKHLSDIRYPGQSTVLADINILDMLPEDTKHYYKYYGSLTTPPCTENVNWYVLEDHIKLSKAQVLKLENTLLGHNNKTLHNDYRNTQPLYKRVVETNFWV